MSLFRGGKEVQAAPSSRNRSGVEGLCEKNGRKGRRNISWKRGEPGGGSCGGGIKVRRQRRMVEKQGTIGCRKGGQREMTGGSGAKGVSKGACALGGGVERRTAGMEEAVAGGTKKGCSRHSTRELRARAWEVVGLHVTKRAKSGGQRACSGGGLRAPRWTRTASAVRQQRVSSVAAGPRGGAPPGPPWAAPCGRAGCSR